MRSSISCLPRGVLSALTLSQDHYVIRAGVLYSLGVETSAGEVVCWLFWRIVRMKTADGHQLWEATAYGAAGSQKEAVCLTVLDGRSSFTAHHMKGLAVALGIWSSMREPSMVHNASVFARQVDHDVSDRSLDGYIEDHCHFGLSARAGATEWGVGP